MNAGAWAVCLIIGMVLWVVGGKWFSLVLMGVGGLGMISCAFGRSR